MMIVARMEPIDLPLFVFQTIRAKAQSTAKEGLPYSVMLIQFMLDVGVVVEHHEPTTVQLNIINRVTVLASRIDHSHCFQLLHLNLRIGLSC